MKPIRLSRHAEEQRIERGASVEEVVEAVRCGISEPARNGRMLHRFNFSFAGLWQGKPYTIKQVAPIVKEEATEIVVVTVYTFYF